MKYTWLAYVILLAESRFFESREIMKGVVHEMQRNVDMPPETALKVKGICNGVGILRGRGNLMGRRNFRGR